MEDRAVAVVVIVRLVEVGHGPGSVYLAALPPPPRSAAGAGSCIYSVTGGV